MSRLNVVAQRVKQMIIRRDGKGITETIERRLLQTIASLIQAQSREEARSSRFWLARIQGGNLSLISEHESCEAAERAASLRREIHGVECLRIISGSSRAPLYLPTGLDPQTKRSLRVH